MRIVGGLVAALLFAALLALGPARVQAYYGPLFATPLKSSSAGDCGTEAPPSQAVAAGFTTCVVNIDWTQTSDSTWLPASYRTNEALTTLDWYDQTGTNSSLMWHWWSANSSYPPYFPASDMIITTDGGKQVMAVHGAVASLSAGMNTYWGTTEGYNSVRTPLWPSNFYAEIMMRLPNLSSSGYLSGDDEVLNDNAAINSGIGFNNPDNLQSDGAAQGGTAGGNDQVHGTYWANNDTELTCFITGSETECNNNLPAGYTPANYYSNGSLVTANGTTYYGCQWLGGVFQSCDTGSPVEDFPYTYDEFQAYVGSVVSGEDYWVYVQYYRVWSCANWQTEQCNGSTLVQGSSGSPGSPTYYEQ